MSEIEVWRGGINPWECDGMGHLNVRFYVSIAMEGLVGVAQALGLPDAFSPDAASTLLLAGQHIRFLREARAHAALHMTAGVVEMGESDAVILQVLYHSITGEPCAALQSRVRHVTSREMRPFAWSSAARARAEDLKVEVPPFAAARSISTRPIEAAEASLAKADELDLRTIGMGAFGMQDCDGFGRMQPHLFIGRISDGINGLVTPFRATVVEHAEPKPGRVGGAALEYRTIHFNWPTVGDRFVIRSGFSAVDGKTQRLTHWVLDPATGTPWGMSEAAVTTFDLDMRKIVSITEEARAILQTWVTPGLVF
ncbi:thioesterase family protein [soil metagenome]